MSSLLKVCVCVLLLLLLLLLKVCSEIVAGAQAIIVSRWFGRFAYVRILLCSLSQCKNAYAADWYRTKQHCPNLVPTALDLEKFGKLLQHSNNQFNVTVYFDKNQIIGWDSLVHLYNDYYRQYLFDANYPRLLVRFEDMLLHAPAIAKKIADCVGLDTADRFTYQIDSAKKHGSHTNFVKAVLKSGDVYARLKSFTADDLEYAAKHLDADLMSAMHYSIPTTPLLPPEEAKQGNK